MHESNVSIDTCTCTCIYHRVEKLRSCCVARGKSDRGLDLALPLARLSLRGGITARTASSIHPNPMPTLILLVYFISMPDISFFGFLRLVNISNRYSRRKGFPFWFLLRVPNQLKKILTTGVANFLFMAARQRVPVLPSFPPSLIPARGGDHDRRHLH